MSKIDPKILAYEGCDLEAMTEAKNYYRWLLDIIKPYFGKNVVEIGAGSGSFSKQLLALAPRKLILVEPTKNMYKLLKETADEHKSKKTEVITYNGYLSNLRGKLAQDKPDTFIYINVFEHIEDDLNELLMIKELLPPGGHVIIFVPALQALYSNFDKSIGHYRRYNKKMVKQLVKDAGLEIRNVRYMDFIGMAPWWVSMVLLKRTKLTPKMVGIYDRFAMPVIRSVETAIQIPVGKNVLIVAQKPRTNRGTHN